MNDREMLLMAYGALKAIDYSSSKLVVSILEKYLFPEKVSKEETKTKKKTVKQ